LIGSLTLDMRLALEHTKCDISGNRLESGTMRWTTSGFFDRKYQINFCLIEL